MYWFLRVLLICFVLPFSLGTYQVGVGRADCTGPTAEITLMGYAKLDQKGCGLHLRQFARAFIFDDGANRVLFVSIDACMVGFSLKNAVLEKLEELYNDTYTHENFILSGTHTHGAPGGFLVDVLYDITELGFCKETFDAYTNGIFNAIKQAHEHVTESHVYFSKGEVDANINRSPASYDLNPEKERKQYEYNTDKTLTQLKIVRASDGVLLGAINWYAVHAVSLNNTNCLVTSDNVGYASVLLESEYNPGKLVGQGDFVGAFASSNLGDVSPNMFGPICVNTGEPCDYQTSTCDGEAKYCIAMGPGENMFESAEIIATRLFTKSKDLLINDNTARELTGPVRFIHQWVEMPKQTTDVQLENGTTHTVKGCLPAMGYGFAAGTTDGPGEFDFKQGADTENPFWDLVRDLIFPPTPEDIDCHFPKPILLATGRIKVPYSWQPDIVSTQILMLGSFGLIGVPGEFTTMAGRRLRNVVKDAIISNGGDNDTEVVIAGLSNTYTSYITTYEEYQLQRFEGAATIFGPHTHQIYLNIYKGLAEALIQNKTVEDGPVPEDLDKSKLLSLITPVLFDTSGWFWNFGDVIIQPPASVTIGETVSVTFVYLEKDQRAEGNKRGRNSVGRKREYSARSI
ncbi:neutral ceramidase-like isoform X2 [Rhynchophorus ferrugineus]|uniref:neutral ceramidase-like isoform X2 n=1 Tax=Rhynchophorus ferrugineus TaxID=354439 RepID=UPI003FCDE336